MADISLNWAGDLTLDVSGDISFVDTTAELQQRIVRRFLTNAIQVDGAGNVIATADYIFEPSYGGNARRYVDSVVNSQTVGQLKTLLMNQANQEAGAATSPPPAINITQLPNGLAINAVVALRNGSVVLIPQLEVTT